MKKYKSKKDQIIDDVDMRHYHASNIMRQIKSGEVDIRYGDYWQGYRDCAKGILVSNTRRDESDKEGGADEQTA